MGKHKALLTYRDQSLLDHLVTRCAPEVAQVLVAGCPEPGLYESYNNLDCEVIEDIHADCGPLGGILAALQACNTPWLATLPCDGITLPNSYFARMVKSLCAKQTEIVYARDSEREQHLYALFSTSLQNSLAEYLASGERKVIAWLQQQSYAVVDFAENDFVFANLNTPEDWENFIQHEN